jgi:hypothetical protein
VFVAALAVAVPACSDDDGTSTTRTPTTSARATTTTDRSGTTTSTRATTTTGISSITLPPVGIGEPAELGENVLVTVTRIEPTTLTAEGPGEIAGPGVIATVEVRNDTDEPFDLGGLAINAHYGDDTPASPSLLPGRSLSGTVAPGQRVSGDFGFRVPEDERDSLVLDIQHSGTPNVVIVEADR